VAVSGSGQILTWGANQNGLLGLGSSAQQNVPTPTPVPDVFAAHVRRDLLSLLSGRDGTVCLYVDTICASNSAVSEAKLTEMQSRPTV
jgi:Regulator of chromosome condensation (RCC1) repeat